MADKKILDRIEGVGAGYAGVNLSIPDFGDCATYLAEDSYVDHSLRPYKWYKELAALGARAQHFPEPYRQLIDAIPAIDDPDKDRDAENWRIVASIRDDGWLREPS